MSREDLGFYLYKRRDFENKAPHLSIGKIKRHKVTLEKLLKTAINDDLILTEGPQLKTGKEYQNKSYVFDDSVEVNGSMPKTGMSKFKEKFDQHLENIRKMHSNSQLSRQVLGKST
jgi:hypothetical protein